MTKWKNLFWSNNASEIKCSLTLQRNNSFLMASSYFNDMNINDNAMAMRKIDIEYKMLKSYHFHDSYWNSVSVNNTYFEGFGHGLLSRIHLVVLFPSSVSPLSDFKSPLSDSMWCWGHKQALAAIQSKCVLSFLYYSYHFYENKILKNVYFLCYVSYWLLHSRNSHKCNQDIFIICSQLLNLRTVVVFY